MIAAHFFTDSLSRIGRAVWPIGCAIVALGSGEIRDRRWLAALKPAMADGEPLTMTPRPFRVNHRSEIAPGRSRYRRLPTAQRRESLGARRLMSKMEYPLWAWTRCDARSARSPRIM
jgi:hypothetical protein